MMLLWTMLVLATQHGPSQNKEECKAGLDQFKAGIHQSSEASRVSAIEVLAKHVCPDAIAALAPLLAADTERVRIAAAKALGGMDHPKSLDALVAAFPANES